jgi:quinol monooxygenase YgiN
MASTTILDMHFKPDVIDEAQELLKRVLDETRAFDGCLGVRVIQDKDDPAHLIAVEDWESLEKDGAYREWRAGAGAITELPGLLADAPSLSICEPRTDI